MHWMVPNNYIFIYAFFWGYTRGTLGTLGRVSWQLFPKYYLMLPYTTIISAIYRWYMLVYISRVLFEGYPTFLETITKSKVFFGNSYMNASSVGDRHGFVGSWRSIHLCVYIYVCMYAKTLENHISNSNCC